MRKFILCAAMLAACFAVVYGGFAPIVNAAGGDRVTVSPGVIQEHFLKIGGQVVFLDGGYTTTAVLPEWLNAGDTVDVVYNNTAALTVGVSVTAETP